MAEVSTMWAVPAGALEPETPRAYQSGASMFTWDAPAPLVATEDSVEQTAALLHAMQSPRMAPASTPRQQQRGGGSPPSTSLSATALRTPALAPPPLVVPQPSSSRSSAASHWPLASSPFYSGAGPSSRGPHAPSPFGPAPFGPAPFGPASFGPAPEFATSSGGGGFDLAALGSAAAARLASAQACMLQCQAHHVVHMSHIGAAWPPANSFLGPHLSVNTGKAPNGGCHGGLHAHA